MPRFLLRTLGVGGLYTQDAPELVLAMGKPLALLVYLALAPGRRMSRESAIDLLWSDVERSRARNAFRQALFQLRRVLGEEAIPGTDELVLIHAIDIDRDEFLSALERNDPGAAIEMYHGAFLPAFGVPGGEMFEQWSLFERERLQAGFVRGAELHVRRLLNESRIADARIIAQRVRALAPDVEATGRLLLEVCLAGRDFLSAAMEANALEQRAHASGDPLESATRAAIARARRIASPADVQSEAHALVAELTGREREFFAITSAWDAVRSGPGRHLHLQAPAGMGKTRLLVDVVSRLNASGAQVVHVRGHSGDRDLPYAFAGDLVAAIAELPGSAGVAPASAAALLALNPSLSTRLAGDADTATGEEALRRRTLALTDLVHAVSEAQRFVLAIDDLHWIDPWSWRMLEGMWSRLGRAKVLCVTAARPERSPTDQSCVIVPLPALSVSQVRMLVSALGSLPLDFPDADAVIAALFDATRGSPLLVLETLKYALDQGILTLDQTEWCCRDAVRLTAMLRAGTALRERVATLPDLSRWLLVLLATAGTALDRMALASLAGTTDSLLAERLEPLERLGLIAHTANGYTPAHDEIGDAARATLTESERMESERCVGAYFARASGHDATGLLRAARHVVASGDTVTAQRLFREYAKRARRHGDRRPYQELAAEFAGESASAPKTLQMVNGLPRTWRVGLWSPARQFACGAVLVLAPLMGLSVLNVREASHLSSPRLFYVDSTKRTTMIAVRPDLWDGTSTPLTESAGASEQTDAAAGYPELPPAFSPDGRSVAWIQNSGDSTTLDIWLRTPAGARRLTHAFRDDIVNGWLPDGSAVVGATDRWSPPDSGGYDIAVFDTTTGNARQVTRGPSHDTNPFVSPDGTRIAFSRGADDAPPRVCVTTIDGRQEPDCRVIGGNPVLQLLGWSGLDEVVVVSDAPNIRPLIAYDWARQSQRTLLGPNVYRGRLSPDRRWAVVALRVDGVRGVRDWIVPLDRPAAARPVARSERSAVRWWEGRSDVSMLIDRLEFTDTSRVVLLGLGTRLGVRLLTAANAEIPLRAPLRWTSSDTGIASVDSLGVVSPHRSGTTTITASLGDWRTIHRALRVEGEAPLVVLRESWDDQWSGRWITWGVPAPSVVSGPGGVRGFWNHGDGSYPSFGMLRRSYSARQGLGAELRLSTPITRTKWQRMRTALVAGIDTALLLSTDQRKAPPALGRPDAMCGLNLPEEGRWGASRVSALGGMSKEFDLAHAATPLRSGAWWTLRIQILPDGRCGVAINGRVLWLSPEPMPLDSDFRLRLGDESNGTRLLHGPLQLWTGVRTDVDWRVAGGVLK